MFSGELVSRGLRGRWSWICGLLTFYRWDLPLHASRVAFRVLSSILGENASAATMWWPFPGNTDAFHFKPVAIQLCHHNLLPFVLNGYSFTCATKILRPFLFVVTLRVFKAARAAVPPPARGCSINAYKTLYLLQYIIVFSG